MSGFDAAWLALREPADARGRAREQASVAAQALAWRAAEGALRVVDLGCGTGSNLRWLAPRLGAAQRWRCIDDTPALLRIAARETRGGLEVDCVRADLNGDLAALLAPAPDLVTASALLDLVSEEWLARLLALADVRAAVLLFALNFDGRLEFSPGQVDDAAVVSAFNAHQRRDKGFGPALGPTAADVAAEQLAAAGWRVQTAASDWQLVSSHPADAALLKPLLEGIARAAVEQEAALSARFVRWHAARLAQLRKGTLRVVVGHQDVLALPAR
jgi:SAM-dependent methyltransferase